MKKRGSYWKDPAKAAQATQAMRDSWAQRRYFSVLWEDGREVTTTSLDEVSKLVHRSTPTLRVYMAKKDGIATFMHNAELITVRRIYR